MLIRYTSRRWLSCSTPQMRTSSTFYMIGARKSQPQTCMLQLNYLTETCIQLTGNCYRATRNLIVALAVGLFLPSIEKFGVAIAFAGVAVIAWLGYGWVSQVFLLQEILTDVGRKPQADHPCYRVWRADA